jgi:hypothetical protein
MRKRRKAAAATRQTGKRWRSAKAVSELLLEEMLADAATVDATAATMNGQPSAARAGGTRRRYMRRRSHGGGGGGGRGGLGCHTC